MEFTVDQRQPVPEPFGALEPTRLSVMSLVVDAETLLLGARPPQYSFWKQCECPDDCPRDHENE